MEWFDDPEHERWQGERGKRYRLAEGARPGVCAVILEDVPFLTFEEASEFYDTVVPFMNRHELAYLGVNDRYFLLAGLCKRVDARHPWLYDRCREVEADPDGYLDLWARWHYKSSIITFAGIIQEILADPEITVGIFSAKNDIARPFLSQIKEELEGNMELKLLYPDVLWMEPKREASSWSVEGGITVRRKTNPKECTVEAFGLIDGSATGRHFRLLVYDDLVTEKLVTNPEMIQKVTTKWQLSDNLGSGERTRKWHVGTRYDFADTYGWILSQRILKQRLYPATHNGKKEGRPVFMSQEKWLDVVKTQPSTYPAQMLQNPLEGKNATFDPRWFKSFDIRPAIFNVYILADPSKGRSATSDRTAIAVIAVDAQNNRYLIDGYCHRMNLSERWQRLRDLHKTWNNRPGVQLVKVGYESYGLQTDISYFELQGQVESYRFGIEELNWTREGKQSKEDRVQRLEPDFSGSRFWLPSMVWDPALKRECYWRVNESTGMRDLTPVQGVSSIVETIRQRGQEWRVQGCIRRRDEEGSIYDLTTTLMEEMTFFPFAPHDDLVDAVSRIYDIGVVPPKPHETESARRLNEAVEG